MCVTFYVYFYSFRDRIVQYFLFFRSASSMLSVARDDRKKTASGKDPKRKRVLWHPFVALNSCKVIKFIENLCLTSRLPRIIYFFDRERAVS